MMDKIRLVELELHSYCNRTCSWCPNSYIDRKSSNKFMDDDVFETLIQGLESIQYSGAISFSRYNEPFAFELNLSQHVKQLRKRLPNALLVANTNGDYGIEGSDLDEITIMDYDNKGYTGESYVHKGKSVRYTKLGSINNRGGALDIKQNFIRTAPCYEPLHFVGVNYDGTVSPCCNIRNDIKKHKPYILGDLHNDSLESILNSDKAVKFRETVSKGDNFPPPCKNCDKEAGRYTSGNGIRGELT